MKYMIILLGIILTGCASLTYDMKDGGKLVYKQVGFISMEGLVLNEGETSCTLQRIDAHFDTNNVAVIANAYTTAAKASAEAEEAEDEEVEVVEEAEG